MQGLNLHVSTRNGNITTNSTYCDHSIFETITGDIILNNTHKNVKISIKEKGNLNIGNIISMQTISFLEK